MAAIARVVEVRWMIGMHQRRGEPMVVNGNDFSLAGVSRAATLDGAGDLPAYLCTASECL